VSGAIPLLPQYALMAWYSFKTQGQLYVFTFMTVKDLYVVRVVGKNGDICPLFILKLFVIYQ
jgi:uncharacterized membrane protein (GlpM family)